MTRKRKPRRVDVWAIVCDFTGMENWERIVVTDGRSNDPGPGWRAVRLLEAGKDEAELVRLRELARLAVRWALRSPMPRTGQEQMLLSEIERIMTKQEKTERDERRCR